MPVLTWLDQWQRGSRILEKGGGAWGVGDKLAVRSSQVCAPGGSEGMPPRNLWNFTCIFLQLYCFVFVLSHLSLFFYLYSVNERGGAPTTPPPPPPGPHPSGERQACVTIHGCKIAYVHIQLAFEISVSLKISGGGGWSPPDPECGGGQPPQSPPWKKPWSWCIAIRINQTGGGGSTVATPPPGNSAYNKWDIFASKFHYLLLVLTTS